MTQEQLDKLLAKAQEQDALGTEQGDADRDRLIQMYKDGVAENTPSTTEDVTKATGAGALTGAASAYDLLGQGATLVQEGPAMLSRMLFGDMGAEKPPAMDLSPQILPAVSKATGGFTEYEPQTTAGEYGRTIGEFAGGAAAIPIGGPLRSVAASLLPAAASETAGQLTEGSDYEGAARLAGALGTPFATSALRQGTQRAILGPEARITQPGTARDAAVKTLEGADVSMTTGLKTGSPRLMALEGSMEVPLETKRTLTTATMKTMGSDSTLATDEAMLEVKTRLGKVFDRADNVVDDVPDMETAVKANRIIEEHMGTSATGDIPPFLIDIGDEILNAAGKTKSISNKKLQNMRSRLRQVMNGTNDPLVYESAFKMNGVVDDFMIESVRRTQPKLVPELMEARDQYRNYLTTMRALKTRGSDSAGGYISPAMLSGALRNREGDRYILGTGSELAKLGRAAEEVVSSMPAVKAGGVRSVGGGGILGAGGGMYAATQMGMDPVPAMMVGGAVGSLVPTAGRAAIRSGPAQNLLMPTQNSAASQMLLDALRSGVRQTGGLLNIPR
tara:strand:- start:54 stop:1736 length:1683 start_codon:yes stop_codon:yes gene_type:complete